MVDIFGISVILWHGLVVEWHTGAAVLAMMALIFRFLTDAVVRGRVPSPRVTAIRLGSDIVAYWAAIFAVIFLMVSAFTGYLIEPYSTMVNDPLLLNKSIVALGALYFWLAYVFVRRWCGPGLWQKKGLYALAIVTALLGTTFTALAGSLGAELSPYGHSVMDPLFQALSINTRALELGSTDVAITAVVMAAGIIIVAVLKPSKKVS